jgi:hypothetical protein
MHQAPVSAIPGHLKNFLQSLLVLCGAGWQPADRLPIGPSERSSDIDVRIQIDLRLHSESDAHKTHKFQPLFPFPSILYRFHSHSNRNPLATIRQESGGIPVEPGSRCVKVLESLSAIVQIIGNRVPGIFLKRAVGSLRVAIPGCLPFFSVSNIRRPPTVEAEVCRLWRTHSCVPR